ncbi:hypothetical protein [Chryseobacterium arthrosphaerae]|uniref:hypothetical protein n=1 Tax=Chryseobacterium arthrosphaerae TaxID=651561 RepID=UPI001E5D5DAC|nr:hypothetical protein [Chryseobacterium arthrosphaerae]UEQ75263.1 hypothetical protein J8N07_16580 [Chryseobacterium arthrosphaerae]
MSDFNFSHLSDTDLVDIIIVEHYRNEEDYQQALLNELKNRNIDINRFNDDNSYIQSFINGFPGGWNIEIKSMFDELQATDWNQSMYIQAKEKYGEFHFSGGNLSDEHIKIIKAHEEIINATCSRCGGKEYVSSNNGHWIEILCRKCAQSDLASEGIYNISEQGFTYPGIDGPDKDLLWKDISNVQFDFSEEQQSVTFDTDRVVKRYYGIEESFLSFYLFQNLNFIKFLITIPDHLLSSSEIEKRARFTGALKKCHFCDKKAVYSGTCRLCSESLDDLLSNYRNNYMRYYNNIENIIADGRQSVQFHIEHHNELNFFYNNDYFPE